MTRDERIKYFYSIVSSLCWINRRPITLRDLTSFLDMTAKRARKELAALEDGELIAKVQVRKTSNGRLCAAWVIADNDNLPKEIRDVCQFCGVEKAVEIYGDERLCARCFSAARDNGDRIFITEEKEAQLSIWYVTVATTYNDHSLG